MIEVIGNNAKMKKTVIKLVYWLYFIKFKVLSWFGAKTLGARALVIQGDELLLVKHTYIDGWHTVGGCVDLGESPLEAVKRELSEEVGLKVHAEPELMGIYHYPGRKGDDYIVLYVVKSFSFIKANSPEIAEWRWFNLDKLPQDISFPTKVRLEEFLKKRPISDKW